MNIVASETDIRKACIDWLNSLPHVFAWRQNRGSMISQYTSKRTGQTKTRRVIFGQPGQSDIGAIGPHGVFIQIEIKKPGEVPSDKQLDWINRIEFHGGIAFYTDSLGECCRLLRGAFTQRQWEWRREWEVR